MKLQWIFLACIAPVLLHSNAAEGQDCTTSMETYSVTVPRVCSTRRTRWFRSRTSYYVCGQKYALRTRSVRKCKGCGGCGSTATESEPRDVTSERVCRFKDTKKYTYTGYYLTYTSTRRYIFWVERKSKQSSKVMYRAKTESKKKCCDLPQVDATTCSKCGVNSLNETSNNVASGVPQTDTSTYPTSVHDGGHVTPHGSIPWQVRLRTYNSADGSYRNCGGVILGSKWILTSAHCVNGSTASQSYAFVGDHDLYDKESSEVRHTFNSTYIQSDYHYLSTEYPETPRVNDYDIALIKTNTSIEFNDYVLPICLSYYGWWSRYHDESWYRYHGETVVTSGWGMINTSPQSDVLEHAFATIVRRRECSADFIGIICVKELSSNSACIGDSGGPMTVEQNGRAELIGIRPSRSCPTTDTFAYTAVGAHVRWIRSHIMNE